MADPRSRLGQSRTLARYRHAISGLYSIAHPVHNLSPCTTNDKRLYSQRIQQILTSIQLFTRAQRVLKRELQYRTYTTYPRIVDATTTRFVPDLSIGYINASMLRYLILPSRLAVLLLVFSYLLAGSFVAVPKIEFTAIG